MAYSGWCKYPQAEKESGIKERLFIYPLSKDEQFEFSTPNFSRNKDVHIEFLGVFDDGIVYAGGCYERLYDFILGSKEGSGAFSFPSPIYVMPWRPLKETAAIEERTMRLIEATRNTAHIFGVRKSLTCQHFAEWIEFNRKFRPYDDFYVDMAYGPMPSHQFDIDDLKAVMERFKTQLTADSLPKGFRDGVLEITESELHAYCKRYGIPTVRVADYSEDFFSSPNTLAL
ncbi:MAG: hypothetical protein QW548_01880 [Candidatus Aenigmatarchaeota archaeon]